MSPALDEPGVAAIEVTSAVSCESPVEVAAIRRNESVLPPTPPPPALTVQVLPEADSLPAGDEEPTSWHVHPEGQLGSDGGDTGVLRPNPYTRPSTPP